MIWILGCLIISTYINHGLGIRFECSLRGNTRIYGGMEAGKRKYFIKIHIFISQYEIDNYFS